MSRIGLMPIPVPAGVQVQIDGHTVTVKGKQGEVKRTFVPSLTIVQKDGKLVVGRKSDEPREKSLHGLTRSLLANMVEGAANGYKINLDLIGTGYRVEQKGKGVQLQVGFSHPVLLDPLGSNTLKAESQIRLVISGPDKESVGEQAASIRKIKPPNVYTGKGIKYDTEVIRRKAGKTGAGATSA